MALTKKQLSVLEPYLESTGANSIGEWGMFCPLHDDGRRSASLNVETGLWYCNACERGGSVKTLVSQLPDQQRKIGGVSPANPTSTRSADVPSISETSVSDWCRNLAKDQAVLDELMVRRGLTFDTICRFEVGWDPRQSAYTIPIRDVNGSICNIRRYQFDPRDDRRKIWSVTGMGSPVLYPLSQLEDNEEIIVCEGEWDAMLLIQEGFAAITRTGAADVWKSHWTILFEDKIVHLCHDMDEKGQKANEGLMRALTGVARSVDVIDLPYEVEEKHGKDVTDFFLEGNSSLDFWNLYEHVDVEGVAEAVEMEMVDLDEVNVLGSFDSKFAGKPLAMRVTITGKRNPPFLLPQTTTMTCSQDAGTKCTICPLNDWGGHRVVEIKANDPLVLEMMNSTSRQVVDTFRNKAGIQKCDRLTAEAEDMMSVEELYVRPSVEKRQSQDPGDYTNRKIVSVGRHDSLPNNTVEIIGAIYPNPRGQQNEFQAWHLEKTETSIDRFEVTPEISAELVSFRPRKGQKPVARLLEIANDLADFVTKIYGRPEMHMLMDLTFHSILQFNFSGEFQNKGWLESLIAGDTRTGKSRAAETLIEWFDCGEMVSCESATFAGIVGGLQQFGTGKEWDVTWGAIPINDRRLVAMDEISGLTTEQIGQMSSIRSSGEAQLTKIKSEKTWARTRLIWMGNPRSGRIGDYTYGVHCLNNLIGNNEDIARFDLAMSVSSEDVDAEDINRSRPLDGESRFSQYAYGSLVRWCWSRKADQVVWGSGVESLVYEKALELGGMYVETPPLVQAANVRIKLARVAVAIAARLFSSDATFSLVMVKREHVLAAFELINLLYSSPGFGYRDHSKEHIADLAEAAENYDKAKQYVGGNRQLAKFLRSSHGHFRRQDLEDMMNMSRDDATNLINNLWSMRMVTRQEANIKIQPILHRILREVPY